jgi:hypothetical protein
MSSVEALVDNRYSSATPRQCAPCVAQLTTPQDLFTALVDTVATQTVPVITITYLLRLCRDEHTTLWEAISGPTAHDAVTAILEPLRVHCLDAPSETTLDDSTRAMLAAALASTQAVPPVVVAHALAQFLDDRYAHTFTDFFRDRSPYQPGVGDPVPLDSPNLHQFTSMPFTSPPWRLANRLDQTRHIRLAGDWAVQFRVIFDYALAQPLAQLIDADTLIATCHPNRSLDEFSLPRDAHGRTFPISPIDLDRQRETLNQLIETASGSGAQIVVLPELCVTETLALELQHWVERPGGPRLLVTGSYHHQDNDRDGQVPARKRNTALAWVRGHDRSIEHDKHSPADTPVNEDIQPQGWPELRIYVIDGWHLVIAVCRDLLNPQAVHALIEVGANLVLVPAMSETLMAFGGQVSSLVGSCQAIVAVANNPGEWPTPNQTPGRPARALFGHPGLDTQTVAVHSTEPGPGVALFSVQSAEFKWLPVQQPKGPNTLDHDRQ